MSIENLIVIPLEAIPNQSFTFTINDDFYKFTIKECNGVMACTIYINNNIIQSNTRMSSGYFLIPYIYIWNDFGNFVMVTNEDDYPYYTNFGVDQYLVYITTQEIDNEISQNISTFPFV
jgi:hypothetical protein